MKRLLGIAYAEWRAWMLSGERAMRTRVILAFEFVLLAHVEGQGDLSCWGDGYRYPAGLRRTLPSS